jgi:hypothetical protein
MFWESEYRLLIMVIPDHYVRVVTLLAYFQMLWELKCLPDAIKWPWLEMAMQVIKSSWAVRKC